ncbi:hypothetical protein L1987_74406 [Smallanthus sonchifolius]|uniref:Uncharacterized protein n=1 Tax=Smallanthus sonchifolius TaxID=185202 RepID=A0ACB9A394_9ASTR|nr:hypothetical protein L1987_74406 [Smallanthus sonchifolius]
MGIERTTKALVAELKQISKEVEDSELVDVAAVSAGNNPEVGNMIAETMKKVERQVGDSGFHSRFYVNWCKIFQPQL